MVRMNNPRYSPTAAQFRTFRATHTPRYATLDGIRWEYYTGGTGDQALLLLPGAPGRGETSFQYVLRLEPQYRVIAPSYPATITTGAALVDGLAALLRAEGITSAHVLGGSYSGVVAQMLLRRYPTTVERLVLSDTGVPDARRARHATHLLRVVRTLPFALVRVLLKLGTYRFVAPMGDERPFWRGYFHALLDGLERDDLVARLAVAADIDGNQRFAPWDAPDWHGSILILDAANDAIYGTAERARLRALYPHATVRTLGDHGHAGSLAAADHYIAAIAAFLHAGEPVHA